MKPSPASGVATSRAVFSLRLAAELVRTLGDAGIGLLLLAGALVAWRRLAGAVSHPAEPAVLLAAGILAAALAATFRLGRGATRRTGWIPTVALATLAFALGVRGTGALGLAALWGPILAEEIWAVWRISRPGLRPAGVRPVRRTAELLDSAFGLIAAAPVVVVVEPQADGEVTQQLVRSRAADGTETLSGWLRLAFAPGQRQATAHLSFCPAFAQAPLLDVRQTEGPAARVKTGQVLPYGVRLEVKLASPAGEAIAVRLAFSARAGESGGR